VAKTKTQFSCQNCGHNSPRWLGRCPMCEDWNSFAEETNLNLSNDQSSLASVRDDFRGMKEATWENIGVHGAPPIQSESSTSPAWVSLDAPGEDGPDAPPDTQKKIHLRRLTTGIPELDRVLGGGLVADSFTLLGGDPGIGKSTLLLQVAQGLKTHQKDLKIFYVSGEESIDQIRGRAHRLGISGKNQIFLASENQLERIFASVKELRPHVLVMDSLQTFSSQFSQSAPGSVSQVREIAARLMALAKSAGISVWLVGHVTKEGNIAGPKTVEHMVDTVLYFEGEGGQSYRLLRTVKNRFGSTQELGVFEMDGEGLREVSNPSSLFLSGRAEAVAGTAVAVPLEGSRPLLVELQALVVRSTLGTPRRTSVGMDNSRISLLAAILEKHMRLKLSEWDLYFNVVGGLRLSEPACDLAASAAIWSSLAEKALPADWVFIGEVGLTGEVRKVPQIELRIQEAKRQGFKVLVLPQSIPKRVAQMVSSDQSVRIITLSRIEQLSKLFST